jgi:hypothetical protein
MQAFGPGDDGGQDVHRLFCSDTGRDGAVPDPRWLSLADHRLLLPGFTAEVIELFSQPLRWR